MGYLSQLFSLKKLQTQKAVVGNDFDVSGEIRKKRKLNC